MSESRPAPGASASMGRAMNWPYELQIGWRYTRAGRAGRRNGFISFISGVSMLGIALGVAALIIVLSVMNGFQKEVRDRMLSVISHVEVFDAAGAALRRLAGRRRRRRARNPAGDRRRALRRRAGADRARRRHARRDRARHRRRTTRRRVTDLAAQLQGHDARRAWCPAPGASCSASSWRARSACATATRSRWSRPAARSRRPAWCRGCKQFTVVGTFDAGHYEYDSGAGAGSTSTMPRKLFRVEGPTGVQLRLTDLHQAPRGGRASWRRASAPTSTVRDWTRTNRNWFAAVQVEKRLMFIILTLIVAVAAFNLVSTLVMTVTDKRADIAILRTLGASPRSVMGIFMVQGALAGHHRHARRRRCSACWSRSTSTSSCRRSSALLHVSFLPSSVYLISRMPSDPQSGDIVPIVVISLVLAFLATLYPSWRASRVQPAEALRYE